MVGRIKSAKNTNPLLEQPISRVVCLGHATQEIYLVDHDDFIVKKDSISVGEKVYIDQVSYQVGGGGTNAAVTFARHGHQSILISNLGTDSAAEAIIDFLIDENVDTSYLNQLDGQTGTSVIMLDSKTASATTMTCLGVAAKYKNLTASDLSLANPDWLYVTSLGGDMEKLLEFVEYAKENQIQIMWSPGKEELSQKKKVLGLLSDIDILILNQKEAKQLVQGEILEELLARLSPYVKTLIITDGANGAIATNGQESYRLAQYEPKKPVDFSGAGDAFGAGFLAGLLDGLDFKNSLIAAAANSTSVISYIGPKTGILSANEKFHPMPIQKLEI